MKTFTTLLDALASQGTLHSNSAAAALIPLLIDWERRLAEGDKPEQVLSDIDTVITQLLRFQQQAGAVLFETVPSPALMQVQKFQAGNDYKLDPNSGESGVWIDLDNIVAHISKVGDRVSVGLHANHELCTVDEPLDSCVLSQADARAFIAQTIRESKVPA